eukprot:COSAG02_NODE_8464_length_2563_cov_3.445530_2_plen_104_part_00
MGEAALLYLGGRPRWVGLRCAVLCSPLSGRAAQVGGAALCCAAVLTGMHMPGADSMRALSSTQLPILTWFSLWRSCRLYALPACAISSQSTDWGKSPLFRPSQ